MNRLSRINHENLQIQKNIFNKFIVQKKRKRFHQKFMKYILALAVNIDLDLFLIDVSFLVEVWEQAEEADGVTADVVSQSFGVVAVDEEELEGVDHDKAELDHLNGRQVFLPPEKLLVARSEGGEAVIAVHDDVDGGVEHSEERWVSAGEELQAPPD